METPILNTPLQVLDNILALNLKITLWSARKKLTAEDFGGVELPPDDLASLGSKKICDPVILNVFTKLKARAFSLLDKNGVRFLSGWAIPEDKAGDIIQGLCEIRDEFFTEKQNFLNVYDAAIADWIARHPSWANIIENSTVSREYVESRMGFNWQLYRVSPAAGLESDLAMTESGLHEEVEGLGSTLFSEIAKDAAEIWKKVFEGKTEVTHKALSPLKTMRNKLAGLSFIDPHVEPAVSMIDTALGSMPKRGNLSGNALLTLQGLVCLLKDKEALIQQTQALLATPTEENVLDDLLQGFQQEAPTLHLPPENYVIPSNPCLDSMGLW